MSQSRAEIQAIKGSGHSQSVVYWIGKHSGRLILGVADN
jgi:hypothetical protein